MRSTRAARRPRSRRVRKPTGGLGHSGATVSAGGCPVVPGRCRLPSGIWHSVPDGNQEPGIRNRESGIGNQGRGIRGQGQRSGIRNLESRWQATSSWGYSLFEGQRSIQEQFVAAADDLSQQVAICHIRLRRCEGGAVFGASFEKTPSSVTGAKIRFSYVARKCDSSQPSAIRRTWGDPVLVRRIFCRLITLFA